MARYTLHSSNFIKRKTHQQVDDGLIYERDWSTLGERHVIESGKKKVYSDYGFLFTDSTRSSNRKRIRNGEWSEEYTEETLKRTQNKTITSTLKLPNSNDIRDYAYYGSSVELVRSSIENIVKWFPCKIWADGHVYQRHNENNDRILNRIITDGHHNYVMDFADENSDNGIQIFLIKNPFNIDFIKDNNSFGKYDNKLRNLPYSWRRYYLNGCEIIRYKTWRKPYNECEDDYNVIYDIEITYCDIPKIVKGESYYDDYNIFQPCLRFEDGTEPCVMFEDDQCNEKKIHIYGLKLGTSVIWCTDLEGLTLMPKPQIIDEYFDNLNGFEACLLTKETTPVYNARLITPIPKRNNADGYDYVERSYVFPSKGYCIYCDTIAFDNYVSSLYKMAQIMDEEWCDNIWENMTHEAIKNFDWTYTREYEDGDELDNVAGGTRLQKIMRIYGRFFDDIKRYIDNIKLINRITLDSDSINGSFDQSKDKVELNGWENYSTILEPSSKITLDKFFIEKYINKKSNRWSYDETIMEKDKQAKWFSSIEPTSITQERVEEQFNRLLATQAKTIFSYKGTKQCIEMVLGLFGIGNDEYEISETYYSVTPINSNELLYYYEPTTIVNDSSNYVDVSDTGVYTLTDYVENVLDDIVNDGNEEHIYINDLYYDLKYITYKNACVLLNKNKVFTKNYPKDIFSGTPIKEIVFNRKKVLVPYFSQDKIYDGDVQFETNGGWGKFTSLELDIAKNHKYDYLETLPYIETLQSISDLLSINQFSIKGKEFYYVVNITDIGEYVDEDSVSVINQMSHYFKLIDKENPQLFNSWRNVPLMGGLQTETEYNGFCNATKIETTQVAMNVIVDGETVNIPEINEENAKYPLYFSITYEDYKTMEYYENMILDNIGNNPHSSQGNYDLGTQYKEYLIQPFKFSIENYGFDEEYLKILSKKILFNIEEHNGEKINIINGDEVYYLPSKQLVITNKIDNDFFKKYFKMLITKYLTQVIPSTTILIFKDY